MFYTERPEGFYPTLEAVGAFIQDRENILLLHRCKEGDAYNGVWGLPSGKMEVHERGNPRSAMLREAYEETGFTFNPSEMKHSKTVFVRYPEKDFIYHIFLAQLGGPISVRLNPREHDQYIWIPPKRAFELPLMPQLEDCIKLVYG